MAILLIAPTKKNLDYWKSGLEKEAEKQGIKVSVWIGEAERPAEVKMAVVWKHKPESLNNFPGLEVVSSMGAGVDHILKDPEMPENWRVVRIIDEELTQSMSNYLLAAVLNYHKKLWGYRELQEKREWGYTDEPEREIQVGVLGLGELGADVARKLTGLGFKVCGYSNSRKTVKGVTSYAGEEELNAFLKEVNLLICLLPLTPHTRGFLNKSFFERCRPGTILVNVARGEHLVEEDLPLALEKGWLSGAMLDVFHQEPLPADHPFWSHPDIIITPHIASVTKPEAAIPQIIENYKRLQQDRPLLNEVNRRKGY